MQKLFDNHLDFAIRTNGEIFLRDIKDLCSLTLGAFYLDGFLSVSHGLSSTTCTYYHKVPSRTRDKT
jgi:hypothetical protein